MLKYKGYSGDVDYDDEAKIFHGEVLDTKDVITFRGKSVNEIEKSFKESIDDYLEFCKERGEEPDKPFSGKFVLRIPSELHHKIYLNARRKGKSINNWIIEVLRETS
jgi:predicted HicB family RNase H-like nuclease